MLYASEIAAKALKLQPIGMPYEGPSCRCAMCTRPIETGDIADLAKMPNSFADEHQLVQGAQYLCGWCRVTTKQSVMRYLQRSVITPDGIYSLNKDSHRAWFWTTPPKPPYAVMLNHNATATFHLHWRVPVTLDNAFVQLIVDEVLHHVRRSRVTKALEASKTVLQHYAQTNKTVINTPFKVLIREPNRQPASNHGILRKEITDLAADGEHIAQAIEYLNTLNPGELQALSCLLKANPAEPEEPQLISQYEGEIDTTPTPAPKRTDRNISKGKT